MARRIFQRVKNRPEDDITGLSTLMRGAHLGQKGHSVDALTALMQGSSLSQKDVAHQLSQSMTSLRLNPDYQETIVNFGAVLDLLSSPRIAELDLSREYSFLELLASQIAACRSRRRHIGNLLEDAEFTKLLNDTLLTLLAIILYCAQQHTMMVPKKDLDHIFVSLFPIKKERFRSPSSFVHQQIGVAALAVEFITELIVMTAFGKTVYENLGRAQFTEILTKYLDMLYAMRSSYIQEVASRISNVSKNHKLDGFVKHWKEETLLHLVHVGQDLGHHYALKKTKPTKTHRYRPY